MVAISNGGFNPAQHNPAQSDGNLPLGRFVVKNIRSDIQGAANNANSGFIKYIAEVLTGEHKGRTGAIRLNVYNVNETARDIANRSMSAMAHAVGVVCQVTDTAMLHEIPYMVEVVPNKDPEMAKKGYVEIAKIMMANGEEPSFQNVGPRSYDAGDGQGSQQQQQSTGFGGQNIGHQQQQQQSTGFNNNGGQPQQQQQQQAQTGFNGGGQQQDQQQQNNGGGFNNGGQPQQQQQQQQQAPANNGGAGWSPNAGQQNNGGGNGPAWGKN